MRASSMRTGGGKAVFERKAQISASSFISIGKHDCLRLGDDFVNTAVCPNVIGNYNWIATRCMAMPGTHTQDYTIVAANSFFYQPHH